MPRARHRGARAATLGVTAAVLASGVGALAIEAATVAAAVPDFSGGSRLAASEIGGDSAATRAAATAKPGDGKRLKAGDIQGDPNGGATPLATGPIGLIDGSGLKWFINDNITFSTSSSASGAASEASYTHAVAASTADGGTAQTTLNDAYDGYEALCVATDNAVNAPCDTRGLNYVSYNKNGNAVSAARPPPTLVSVTF